MTMQRDAFSVSDHNIGLSADCRAAGVASQGHKRISDLKRTRRVCMMIPRAEKLHAYKLGKTLIFPSFPRANASSKFMSQRRLSP
ncbi:hypothetical protein K788_0000294 [Paraburkholderia caribensis MBA4]|uniref:Uncharacterized protein n=1 Tax=Paraburkholderia caribensis MBA4 TaxID=1323664 RepID=A0A0P0RIU8_9BURK|nr:hypothetical protein K788_0000294 [Paraburkholderia caribensis MBA4]